MYRVSKYNVSKKLLVAAVSCGLALIPAVAATVDVSVGTASVNQGQGFRSVASGASVSRGDVVMVSPGGNASLVYENGCAVRLSPGAVVTVGSAEQCAKTSGEQKTTHSTYDDPNAGAFGGVSPATVAVGVGVAGAVGAAIYFATKKKTSP